MAEEEQPRPKKSEKETFEGSPGVTKWHFQYTVHAEVELPKGTSFKFYAPIRLELHNVVQEAWQKAYAEGNRDAYSVKSWVVLDD